MKKTLKLFFITLASLLVVLIIAISFVLWFAFTPEKLTPFVQKQASKYITCDPVIGDVELTFFSTFPQFGLKIRHLNLINNLQNVPNDTLVNIEQALAIVDIEAWWNRNEIKIDELTLTDGTINIFYDSLGHSNYNIFLSDTLSSVDTLTTSKPFDVAMDHVGFENINFSYIDRSMDLIAVISKLSAEMEGTYESDIFSSTINIAQSNISLEYDGEKYLHNVSTQLKFNSVILPTTMQVDIKDAFVSLNELAIQMNGTLGSETQSNDLVFDLNYNLAPSSIDQLLKMIPPSYSSYFEDIDASGQLAIDGKIKGIMNDSLMPQFDVHLLVDKGKVKYEGFPLLLHDVNGDVTISTDGMTNARTFVRIDRFSAKTPQSTFNTKGLVNRLFSDVYCNLTTNAQLTLEEFIPMVPDDIQLSMKGKAQGQIKSVFTMDQLDQMQIEKMRLSGMLTFSDIDLTYDSLLLKTDYSSITFALPYSKATLSNTSFAYANITTKNLEAGMLDTYNTKLRDANFVMETSDLRDTTRIPDLICSFKMNSIAAEMDTMSLEINSPEGEISLSPRLAFPDQPQIKLTCSTQQMYTEIGKNSTSLKKLNFDAFVENHNEEKDVFLQWPVKGVFNMEECNISMTEFNYPIEIPLVKMNVEPEMFQIDEGKLKIGNSDFQVTGNLENILSYLRGDSILKGNLDFSSKTTDVLQLMNMTSGMGTVKENPDSISNSENEDSGPYMVPKGIDILLNANIQTATFGIDTASNIKGNVDVKDGLLVLDDIELTTPAARMLLTAMYRTPRKNHLYLGLDYHMFNIEIEELLQMIPDIDTIMPMLRSFSGKGEFHLAIETYLDSMYNVKKSTLRGASSINGQDLVLMDGETFSEIAKKLMFKKKTVNRVDSLSAEFTIFRDEIDIYPFLIVMDKYKAVIAGRHNFDLSFNYHISVVDCPLPVKLGIDIKGTMDDMSYSLAKCKYAEFYRPSSRRVVENKQLELRKMIREALTKNVSEYNLDN